MLTRHQERNLTWVDLTAPTAPEVRALMQEFGFHPRIAQELLAPSAKSKVERDEGAVYAVLHFPALRGVNNRPEQEIDFIIGRHYLITAHYEEIDPLHSFAQAFEVQSVLGHLGSTHGGHLFASIARALYQSLEGECVALRERIREIEAHIFAGNERKMVLELSHVSRIIHDFRQALLPHEEMLASLSPAAERLFGAEFSYYMRGVEGEYKRLGLTLGHLRDSLQELRETNNSLLTTKQNDIIKNLTMMAFMTFPLALIAALFGMGAHSTPIIGVPGDFWFIALGMVVLVVGFFVYFKRKGWL